MNSKKTSYTHEADAALRREARALLARLRGSASRLLGRPRPAPRYRACPSAARMQAEAEKQRRVPGIVFVDGPAGRRARIAGTGIEVFEIAKTYRAVGGDRARLQTAYDWLSNAQIDAALAYAAAYPDEVAARLAQEAALESSYHDTRSAR